jgi:hypothetical protein
MRQRLLRLLFHFRKNGGLPLLFILLIFLPLADMLLHIGREFPIREKRKLAARPRFEWQKPWDYLSGCEKFFNDHFGFRSWLLRRHNLLMVLGFGASPTDHVVIGRQGWLFMGRETEQRDEMDYFRQRRPFTPAELGHWRLMLRQRRQWLAEHGVAYLFLVVPNKSTIYPEYLPAHIRRPDGQSRLDQLLAELDKEKDFPVIDLRNKFFAAKSAHRLYSRTDSHWNDLGAYFAFAEIMERLADSFPCLSRPSLDRYAIRRSSRAGGDLAQMLGLQKKHYREQAIRLRPRDAVEVRSVQSRKAIAPYIRVSISEAPAAELPTLLMVHDSFAHQLKPFLGTRFRRVVYVWDWGLHFFRELVEREKPAVIIDQIAERMLCDLQLENPPELDRPATP